MRDTDLKRQRDKALYRVYIRGLREGRFTSMRNAGDIVSNEPAPEFFISAREASLLVGRIISLVSLCDVNEYSRRRAWCLYSLYADYLREHPGTRLTRERILEEIVERPAPSFFMSPEMARKIIMRESRKRRRLWQG